VLLIKLLKPAEMKILYKSSFLSLVLTVALFSCKQAEDNPFWGEGEQLFELQEVFTGERFPNVVVAMDGSVIATWGSNTYKVRRSEDGGATWGPVITVADPGRKHMAHKRSFSCLRYR
jgi:sialidase-1